MKASTKERNLLIVREVIVTQTNHWSMFGLAYGLSVMLSEVFGVGRLSLLRWGLMGIGLLLNYVIRIRVDKTAIGILLHIPVLALMAVAALPELVMCGLHAAFALFYTLLSVSKYLSSPEQEDEPFPIAAIAMLICIPYFILIVTDYPEVTSMYRNLLICLFTMFFIQHYFGRYTRFVKLNERSAGFFPKSEIMGAGLKNVIIYVGIATGFFFAIANMDSLTAFGEFLKTKIGYYLRQFFRKIFSNAQTAPDGGDPLDYNDFDSLTTQLGQGEARQESVFWIIVEKILWVGIILLLLYGLYRMLLKILSLFNLKLDRPEIMVDEVVTDVRESCDKSGLKQEKKRKLRLFLTPAEKVRRQYKLATEDKCYRICKSGDTKRLGYYTAGECSKAVDLNEMGELYDKARYSFEETTEKDAERMKKICTDLIKE